MTETFDNNNLVMTEVNTNARNYSKAQRASTTSRQQTWKLDQNMIENKQINDCSKENIKVVSSNHFYD